jgi:hypothetical protein
MEYDFEQFVEAFEFLDELRESGQTNMFGASANVMNELGHDRTTARNLVSAWMKSYDGETSVEDRAKKFKNNY